MLRDVNSVSELPDSDGYWEWTNVNQAWTCDDPVAKTGCRRFDFKYKRPFTRDWISGYVEPVDIIRQNIQSDCDDQPFTI